MRTPDERLHFTGNDAADRLNAQSPLALLIGFALDQQVTVQKAFSGPLEIERRLGHLDAGRIAAMDPAALDELFRQRPAIHRFPGAMAGKIHALCTAIVERHGGDAGAVWGGARDGADLRSRLLALPGFGEMKVGSVLAVLGKRMAVRLPGMEDVMPKHPTLGDVDSAEALAEYQAGKRAWKAEQRARGERA